MIPGTPRADRTASVSGQGRRFALALLATVPACLLVLLAAVVLAEAASAPVGHLLRDPVAVLGGPFFVGAVSNLGLAVWTASVTVCLFAAAVIARSARPRAPRPMFLAGAALSAWLLADDALLLHDQVLPDYLGVSGAFALLVGLVGTAAFLVAFRRTILARDPLVLGAALTMFVVSLGIDQLHDLHLLGGLTGGPELLLEDGAKLLGALLWLAWFSMSAFDAVTDGDAR